jgi:hypothetical protein
LGFKLNVDDIIGKPISDVRSIVNGHYKCALKDLTYLKMLVDKRTNEAMRHGVYMIFNESDKCVYVGKCESTHFVDRLGFHFGMSPNYKHTFLSKYVNEFGFTKDFAGYVKATSTIENYKYLIINANKKGSEFIRKLEKMFMVIYQPTLNILSKKIEHKKFADSDIFQKSLYR